MIDYRTFGVNILLLILWSINAQAQEADSLNTEDSFTTSAQFYTEFYSATDLIRNTEVRPDFVYSHKRLNGVAPNIMLLKLTHGNSMFRINAGVMLGDYVVHNLASEKGFAKQIFEANAEMRLFREKSIWLTVGVMPSHIGFESAIGLNNLTLTRSIVADNSPYYETGAKLTYNSKNEKWSIAGLVVNGWQRINSPALKVHPGLATQINFVPDSHWLISWNTYTGNVKSTFRFYNNVYAAYKSERKVTLILSADLGIQSADTNIQSYFAPVLIVGYQLSSSVKSALRIESYRDQNASIISSSDGFNTHSISLNLDWQPMPYFMFRGEYKYGNSPLNNFNGESRSSLLTAAIIISVQ
ncbi:MAG: hypothetical protein RL007_2298 [Bacteroidota bacterium]|jgi:hypothetical protein